MTEGFLTEVNAFQFLFLHGLGASNGVWDPLRAALAEQLGTRGIALDLPGHGAAERLESYALGEVAAIVSRRCVAMTDPAHPLAIIGHSYGGLIGLVLASHWFALKPSVVFGIGIKTDWTDDELNTMARLATRPVKLFEHEDEARAFFLRVSGLPAEVAQTLSIGDGVLRGKGGWHLAQDPRTNNVTRPPMEALRALAACPFHLARGDGDCMVTLKQLKRFDPGACDFVEASHNAMVDASGQVLDWVIDRLKTTNAPVQAL